MIPIEFDRSLHSLSFFKIQFQKCHRNHTKELGAREGPSLPETTSIP